MRGIGRPECASLNNSSLSSLQPNSLFSRNIERPHSTAKVKITTQKANKAAIIKKGDGFGIHPLFAFPLEGSAASLRCNRRGLGRSKRDTLLNGFGFATQVLAGCFIEASGLIGLALEFDHDAVPRLH